MTTEIRCSLPARTIGATTAARAEYGTSSPNSNTRTKIPAPRSPGSRESSGFLVQTKSEQIEIPDIKNAHEITRVVSDMPVVFHELKKNGETWELRVGANPQAFGPNRWNQFNQMVQNNLRLLDEKGQALDHRGMPAEAGITESNIPCFFANSTRPADGRPSTEPAKLVWEVPRQARK